MKKIVNKRYPFFIFVLLCIGVLCAMQFCYGYLSGVLIAVAFAVAVVVLCLVFSSRKVVDCVVFAMAIAVGFASSCLWYCKIENDYFSSAQTLSVSGYVSDLSVDKGDYVKVVVRNAKGVDLDQEEYDLGNVVFYYYGTYDVKVGNKVTLKGDVANNYVFKDSVNTYFVKNRLFFTIDNAEDVLFSQGEATFAERCRAKIKESLWQQDEQTSSLGYALLLGDKQYVEEETISAFRQSGTIHVLAVSGLHVGFISAIVIWLLKKLRVKGLWRIIAVLVPLSFYAYLCGFSPSVVRAVVMTTVTLVCDVFWSNTDILNSLSVAGIIILTVSPLQLFDAGFLLSFGAVFGIATVSVQLIRIAKRKKTPKLVLKLLEPVLVSVGATCGTLCQICAFYGSIAVYSVLANLVVVPLIGVSFVLALFGLLPFCAFLLKGFGVLMNLLVRFAKFVASLPVATIPVHSLGVVACVVWVVWLLVIGGFVRTDNKKIANVVFACLFAVAVGVTFVPYHGEGKVEILDGSNGFCVLAVDENASGYAVCNLTSASQVDVLSKALLKDNVKGVTLCFTDYYKVLPELFEEFCQINHVDGVLVVGNTENDAVSRIIEERNISKLYLLPNRFDDVICYLSDGAEMGVLISVGNVKVVVDTAYYSTLINYAEFLLPDAPDVVFVANDYLLSESFDLCSTVIYQRDYFDKSSLSVSKCGNFTITSESGKMVLLNR